MKIVHGNITEISEQGFSIWVSSDKLGDERISKNETVAIGIYDKQVISREQQNTIYSLLGSIADWMGELPEYVKRLMKVHYIHKMQKEIAQNMFSLRDCEKDTATEFLSYLLDFALAHEVPLAIPLTEYFKDDIEKAVYSCLMHKKCICCGKPITYPYVRRIQLSPDESSPIVEGNMLLPLCSHHIEEIRAINEVAFIDKHHVKFIPATKNIIKKYKKKGKPSE